LAALTSPLIPPNAAADVALAASTPPPLLLDELLLPHPAASTTLPRTAAMAAPVLFSFARSPSDLHGHAGQDGSIVAGECEGKVSVNQVSAVQGMNDSSPGKEF
jgi:hypothetical protein